MDKRLATTMLELGSVIRIIGGEVCHLMWNHGSVLAGFYFDRGLILVRHSDTGPWIERRKRVVLR